jgi:hypothetical protein
MNPLRWCMLLVLACVPVARADPPPVVEAATLDGYRDDLTELRRAVSRIRAEAPREKLTRILNEADWCCNHAVALRAQPLTGEISWRMVVCLGYIRGVITGIRDTVEGVQ